jgi:hypothetical protein
VITPRFAGAALAVSLVLLPCTSRAQEASRAPEAEALFEQGRKLAAEGRWAEACPKLAASEQADPGAGTLLNLGNCYEQNHQPASAWATFKEAASMAKQQGRSDWEALARTRAAALEPKLSKLTIAVAENARAPGLVVKRDGVPVASGAWGTPLPLDPQAHVIEASAPGKVTWSKTVALGPDAATETVTVPVLGDAPVATAKAVATAPAPGDEGSTQRLAGLVVGGIGVIGVAIGAVTGAIAISKEKTSRDACPSDPCATADGFQANEDARTLARVSTIAFVAGGVVLATGAVIWLTAPRAKTAAAAAAGGVRLSPLLDRRSAGLGVLGTW